MKNRCRHYISFLPILFAASLFAGCFSRLPDKHEVYFNNFEGRSNEGLAVYDHWGKVDSNKIVRFYDGNVFGFFNNNRVDFEVKDLPEHNVIKIEFDLLIHDKWDGDYIRPGGSVPDVWQMVVDGNMIYQTTFSNGTYGQSFPRNYVSASTPSFPARANSWASDMPGVCALKDQVGGTALYKIELLTAHSGGSVSMSCNDALQPFQSYCAKSWSIDNLRVTTIKYN